MRVHNMIEGLDSDSLGSFSEKEGIVCHECPHGHAHKRPIAHSSSRIPSGPGECIYMDVGGPMPVRGLNDELYFNMARCRYLGHRVIYFMKTKDEIVSTAERYGIPPRHARVRQEPRQPHLQRVPYRHRLRQALHVQGLPNPHRQQSDSAVVCCPLHALPGCRYRERHARYW